MDFAKNIVEAGGNFHISTVLSLGRRILFPIKPTPSPLLKTSNSPAVYASECLDYSSDESVVSPVDLHRGDEDGISPTNTQCADLPSGGVSKLHRQLGSISHSSLSRLIHLAKRKSPEQNIIDALGKCSCHRIDAHVKRLFGSNHLPAAIGDVVLEDAF